MSQEPQNSLGDKVSRIIESPFASATMATASCALAITVVVSGIGLVQLVIA